MNNMMLNQNRAQPLSGEKQQLPNNGQASQGLPANYDFLKNMVLEEMKKTDLKQKEPK